MREKLWFENTHLNYTNLLDWIENDNLDMLREYSPFRQFALGHIKEGFADRNRHEKYVKTTTEDQRKLNEILSRNSWDDSITSHIIEFADYYPIAATGVVHFQCECYRQYNLSESPRASFTLFPQNGKMYVVFSTFEPLGVCLDQMLEAYYYFGINDHRIFLTHFLQAPIARLSYERSTQEELANQIH